MYDRILVPTDGSRGATNATRHAFDLAARGGATVHALSVVRPPHGVLKHLQSEVDFEERAQRAVDRVARAAPDDIEVVSAVRRGRPAETILDYAGEADVDLLVLGTHGRTGVERQLLGSVTERVVRLADVPVLTVALEEAPTVTSGDDATERARRALEERGLAAVEFPEAPSPQQTAWVVRAEADDRAFNVYVDRQTGEAHVVPAD